jgi:hypothetical protein
MNGEFQVFYPGIYTEREKPWLKQFLDEDQAIRERGPINIQAIKDGTLAKDTPGVFTQEITEEMIRYNALKYAPENPLFHDEAYAISLGYQSLPALPTIAAHDDSYIKAYPAQARDYLLVSGLNHEISFHHPVCAGDTMYLVVDERHLIDCTPKAGSVFRSMAIETSGSIYNQNGELVNKVVFRVMENLKSYVDPADMPEDAIFWIGPAWEDRKAHYYTDEDWETILNIWKHEYDQGATPLYWEDVPIGFRPADTLDGPVDDSIEPTYRFGMGNGGTRTLRKEIENPEFRKTMIRSKVDGIYRMPNRADAWPEAPKADIKYGEEFGGGERSVDHPHDEEVPRYMFINFMGRDYALRHFNNFMGHHGKLVNIKWGIMSPDSMASVGYDVPASPNAVDFLSVVPEKAGKAILIHGLERDVMWVKSYVFDKYCQDGKHYVKLAWWIDTILGETFQSGQATIQLPSQNGDID